MTVKLDAETERIINEQVKAGVYETPELMIRAGIERLMQEVKFAPGELQRLCKAGLDQLDRGERVPAEQVFSEIRQRSEKRRAEQE